MKPDNHRLHILYLCIIFAITTIFLIICFCKGKISDEAFQNVSFAATVSSIILAVISIVISLNAADSTANNLGSITEVERKLTESLYKLQSISETLRRTEKKIDKLPVNGNLVSSVKAQDSRKLTDESVNFITPGEKKDNTYAEIEKRAINTFSTKLGLEDVEYDVSFKTNKKIVFDAKAKKNGISYIIEVKICNNSRSAISIYNNFLEECKKALEEYDENNLDIYLIYVSTENKKEEIEKEFIGKSLSLYPEINIIFFNVSDLNKQCR